jgi:hypothetical protein
MEQVVLPDPLELIDQKPGKQNKKKKQGRARPTAL